MPISGVLIYNSHAEAIIHRFYKSDYSRIAAEAFRVKVVQAKNYGHPVLILDRSSFMYVKYNDLIIAAITKKNANATLVFQYLYSLIDMFRSYFDDKLDERSIRSNFTLVYELLDEAMDHGYPQITSSDLLKQYIHHGTSRNVSSVLQVNQTKEIINSITGSCPWRPEGKFHYTKNEVYLDVIEHVSVTINQQGKELQSYCKGKIIMKSSLSGMPVCRFGLNDKVAMASRRKARGSKKKVGKNAGIDLEDISFHKCVRLSKYDQDKTIMFTPPDGEFELMTYRINKTNLPFKVQAMVSERGRNRVEYHVKVTAEYEQYNVAQDIEVKIPVPGHTSSANMKVSNGKFRYEPTKSAIVWKIAKLVGKASLTLKGDVKLAHLIQDKQWGRPPITLQFTIPMWPASGMKVRFLNVQEPKLNYKSIKWVRYITHAGDYQIRI